MVSFMHEQNSICSQKQLNDIAHEHTIIYRQLFAGHMLGFRLMKRKKHLHDNNNNYYNYYYSKSKDHKTQQKQDFYFQWNIYTKISLHSK